MIAPSSAVHPPDYDPKPSDLTRISAADYVLYAPFDSFAPRIKDAVGSTATLVEVKLENTPGNIRSEVTRLGQLFGTQDKAAAWLSTFEAEETKLAASVRAAVPAPAPTAVSHLFMGYWGEFAGVAVTGTYGPEPISATQLADLIAKKPALVLANSHLPPSPDIPGARTVELVNFLQADLDLLGVFRTNADRLTAALRHDLVVTEVPPAAGTDAPIPVLVVGGGPVGLSVAIGLARFGIRALLVERLAEPSEFPRGRALSTRTMEIFRQWGLAEEIIAAGLPASESLAFYTGATLVADRFTRHVTAPVAETPDTSPMHTVICSQDRLEPVLRAHAGRAGVQVRIGTELVGFEAGEHAVCAALLDRRTGQVTSVRTRFLVAADGSHSGIREHLDIPMEGPALVAYNLNILFEAQLRPHVADRLSVVYTITGGSRHGTLLTVDNDRRWLFNLAQGGTTDPGLDRLSDDMCCAIIREASGLPDLPVRLVDRRPWRAGAQVAAEFRRGRVLLAGDAAHVMTPYGGFGMNCGIADAHNLGWKLAGVLSGWAGPGLLDTYQAERRPVAVASAAESHHRLRDALAAHRDGTVPPPRPSDGLVLGYHYDSAAVVDDGTPCPHADPVADHVPTARPGHRAPHTWHGDDRPPLSSLDTIGPGFSLWAGPAAEVTSASTAPLAAGLRVPLQVHRMGPGPDGVGWMQACGIGPDGLVLVRPDGHVAWRCASSGTVQAALAALRHVLR